MRIPLLAVASLLLFAVGCPTPFECCDENDRIATCYCDFNSACDASPWVDNGDGTCSYVEEEVDAGAVEDAGT